MEDVRAKDAQNLLQRITTPDTEVFRNRNDISIFVIIISDNVFRNIPAAVVMYADNPPPVVNSVRPKSHELRLCSYWFRRTFGRCQYQIANSFLHHPHYKEHSDLRLD